MKLFAEQASCLGLAFHVLAYYEEDTGRTAAIRVEDSGDCRIVVIDEAGCATESLEAAKRALPLLLGGSLRSFTLDCSEGNMGGGILSYRGIVSRLLESARYGLVDCLRRLAVQPPEYFYIAGWNGLYAFGPGDEYRVSLPQVPGVVFAHTHPGGLCYPSGKDLRSTADFLSSGGLAEIIVSPRCTYAIYLEAPMAEDDYWALQEAARCVNNAKDGEEYISCLQRLAGLKTVATSLL